MSRLYVFADEAGDFTFRRGRDASKYFVACTITLNSCDVGEELLRLRREMAWNRMPQGDYFHATTDTQKTRDFVFDLIANTTIRIDATVLEKSKTQVHTRVDQPTFYQHAWFFHFKHLTSLILKPRDELQVTIASIGTKKGKGAFLDAINKVLAQTTNRGNSVSSFWPAQSDPCLQIADYCTWAIQRKWERSDSRSHSLIKSQIHSEYDLYQTGTTHRY